MIQQHLGMNLNAVLSYHNSHQLSPMYPDDVHIQTKDVARYVQVIALLNEHHKLHVRPCGNRGWRWLDLYLLWLHTHSIHKYTCLCPNTIHIYPRAHLTDINKVIGPRILFLTSLYTHIYTSVLTHIYWNNNVMVFFPLALTLASLACSIDRLTHIHRYMPLLMCEYTLTHTSPHSRLPYKHTQILA